jgi:hypothetical protein
MELPGSMSDAVASDRTTRLENAHGTEFREPLYPWHRWFGLRVGVHQAIDRPEGLTFRSSLRGSDSDRWLEVPAWMFDRSVCTARVPNDAHVDFAAIVTLRDSGSFATNVD